ncbi:MAG: YggS family pyridoxal phosphate-dependent enzyme [Candidatus Heimdallarchaeota archaeon]|nr:YggS family pyridoxal phosphate-dependent enzyme [Candidatus Heimdallarchaeota archaeon]
MNHKEKSDLIEKNWQFLNDEVVKIADETGRSKPRIIAVTKTRNIEEIEIAYDLGIRDFGENYAQELEQKAQLLPNANWHFIGHLQRGNAKRIAPHCNMLHTLDSVKLAKRLSNLSFKSDTLIQIKMGTELSKFGITGDLKVIEQMVNDVRDVGLTIVGLMGIGSMSWDRNETLKQYSEIAELNQKLGLSELSLGMSDDYPLAIIAGSTMIRVGTKIFGPRE